MQKKFNSICLQKLQKLQKRRKHGEKGSALVAVLCLVFLGGMLAAAVAGMTFISTMDMAAHTSIQRSYYINEGVMNRVGFLISADRNQNGTNQILGDIDYEEYEYDRFLPDGVIHEVDYYGDKVQVTVYDAISGWDLSSASNRYRSTLRAFTTDLDTEQDVIDAVNDLTARIADYVDSNDTVSTSTNAGTESSQGMEKEDYESEKMRPLPRDGAMQYREELYYIKGLTDFFPPDKFGRLSHIRLIPPEGTVVLNGTPSFFSATPQMISLLADLEEDELASVLAAREKLRKERIKISDELDMGFPAKLQRNMSWTPSNYYTVNIEPSPNAKRPSKRLTASFGALDISGANEEVQEYLEWVFY